MAKKRPIKPETIAKVEAMLVMLQKEINADPTFPIYKLPKLYGLASYYTNAIYDMQIVERVKPGVHRMKVLKFTDKLIEDCIRCANKKAAAATRKYTQRKKEELEAQEAIKAQKEHIKEVVEEQHNREEARELKHEVKTAESFEYALYGGDAKDVFELKKQLKKANDFLLEAKGIIEKRDLEILKLKTYINYLQQKDIEQVFKESDVA